MVSLAPCGVVCLHGQPCALRGVVYACMVSLAPFVAWYAYMVSLAPFVAWYACMVSLAPFVAWYACMVSLAPRGVVCLHGQPCALRGVVYACMVSLAPFMLHICPHGKPCSLVDALRPSCCIFATW